VIDWSISVVYLFSFVKESSLVGLNRTVAREQGWLQISRVSSLRGLADGYDRSRG